MRGGVGSGKDWTTGPPKCSKGLASTGHTVACGGLIELCCIAEVPADAANNTQPPGFTTPGYHSPMTASAPGA